MYAVRTFGDDSVTGCFDGYKQRDVTSDLQRKHTLPAYHVASPGVKIGCLAELSISRSGRVSESLGVATRNYQRTMAILNMRLGSSVYLMPGCFNQMTV